MVVKVETESDFKQEPPQILFPSEYSSSAFDIHPQSKRFLFLKYAVLMDTDSNAKTISKIKVVTNWYKELKQRVPVD